MREIDERVVELRFKNSNFEKNAKSTIGVLDKLEQKLAFPKAKQNIEGLEKEFSKISFKALEKGIDAVTVKFSALQIAGITAIQNITNKAINAGEALVKSLSIDQITAGFTKYEQKTTAVQTIVSATGKTVDEVNRALNKLNWFTDETSYNFVDMVSNIGKFTAAGVDLEDAMSAMIGIANEAAVSGQNATAASHAMMNFSQALGSGAVKLQDWKSIQTVNMDTIEFKQTIIDTAVAMGTLEKTAEGTYKVVGEKDKLVDAINFTNELKTGWFTSDVLVESLKKYSDYAEQIYEITQKEGISASEAMERFSNDVETLGEKAFKAGQVAKTFTDAIDATKDAVSTQWMKTFELIVGDLDQASETWTELTGYLWDFFAQDLENLNSGLAPVLTSNYKQLIETLKELGITEEALGDAMTATAKKHGLSFDQIVESFGSLEAVLTKGGYTNILTEALDDMTNGAEVATTKVVDLTDKMEEYNKVVMDVIKGNYKNGVEARTKALAEAGYEFSVIQPLVNKWYEKGSLSIEDYKEVLGELTEEELANIKITGKQADELKELANKLKKPSGRELIIDSFRNALKGLQKVIETVKEAWVEIFPPKTQEEVYAIIEKFHDFSRNLILNSDGADKLKRSLKGVFAALDIVRQVVGGAIKSGLTILGKLFGKTGLDVGELSASLGDNLVAIRDWLNDGNKIGVMFEALTYSILNAKATVTEWINSFLEKHPAISKWFDGLIAAFDSFKEKTKDKWSAFINEIKNGNIKEALDIVASYFLEFRDTVISYLTGIDFNAFLKKGENEFGFGSAVSVLDSIKSGFLAVVEAIKTAAVTAGGWVSAFVKSLNPMWFIPVLFIGIIVSINKLSQAVDGLLKVLRPLEEVKKAFISTLNTIGKSVNKFMTAAALAKKSEAVVNFALAILMLSGAMWVLAQVPTNDLIKAGVAVGALMVALVVANGIMSKWGKQGKGLARLTNFAAALGVAIFLAVGSLKIIETIDTNKLCTTVVSFIAVVLSLGLAILGLGFIPGKEELAKINSTLIVLAITIGLVSSSLVLLSIIPTEGLGGKVLAIAGVLLELVGVIALLNLIQKKLGTEGKAVASLIGMVVALDLLVLSLQLIESVKVRDIIEHLGSFIAVFAMLNILAKIAGGVSGGSGGWQILALATGLLILVPAINSFSDIKLGGLAKAVAAVGVLLLVEGVVVAFSKFAGGNAVKAGAMILMIAGSIAALSLVIWGFSALDLGGLAQGVAAVGILMIIISGMLYAAKEAEASTKTIVFLTLFTIAMGAMVAIIAGLDPDAAIKSTGSVSMLLLAMAVSMKILSTTESLSWHVIDKSMIQLLGLTALATLFSTLILKFSGLDPEKCIQQATALGVMLLAMSGAVAILVKFGQTAPDAEIGAAVGVTFAMMGVLLALGMVSLMIKDLDPVKMTQQFAGLSAAILMLEICALGMIGLAKVIVLAGGSGAVLTMLGEAGAVVGIVAGIGLVLALLFGVIENITNINGGSLNDTLKKGVETMTLIGNAVGSIIGGFVGGIIGGIGEATLSHMEQMGKYLSAFAKSIGPFLERMENIKPEVGKNVSLLTKAILDLTAADFMANLSKFGEFIAGGAIGAAKNVIGYANGETGTPFDDLGRGLESFGDSVEKIADKFAEMSERGVIDDLEKGLEITTKFTSLLKEVPTRSAFGNFFKGKLEWTNLTASLEEYGRAVFNYSAWAVALNSGTKIESIEKSIGVAESLNDLLNKLEPSGGLVKDIFGNHDWSTLSTGLADVGSSLAKYGEEIKDVTPVQWLNIAASAGPAGKLAALLENLEPAGGLISKVFGDNTTKWSVLSTGLEQVGTALTTFGAAMTEFEASNDWDAAERSIPLLEQFVNAADTLVSMTGLGSIKDTVDNAATIMGDGLAAFGNAFDDDWKDNSDAGIKLAKRLVAVAKDIKEAGIDGKNYLTNFGKDINGYAQNVSAAARTLKNIENEQFRDIAMYALQGFNIEFQNGIKDTTTVIDNWAVAVKDTSQEGLEVNSPSKFFKWLAANCTSGFVNTFSEGFKTVKNASNEFTEVVRDTVQNGLGVHSDSTFFSWIAENCDGGFVHTLEAGATKVKDAVSGWVTNVTDSLNLDTILDQFSDFGIDLKSVLPDVSSLGFDFGEDMTFSYEKQIAEMQESIKQLTKDLGKDSDEVIKAQLELDNLKDEYKAYTKSRTENTEYYEDKAYSEAQKQFDKLLEDYKNGRKTQEQFDDEYTKLLETNTAKQVELFQYTAQALQTYVTDKLDKVQDKFETKISEIQSRADSMKDNLNKTFGDQFKFKTNQDVYDEEISKYDKQISVLNKKLEKEKELYGENSVNAKTTQKQIDQLEKDKKLVEESWSEYDDEYMSKIVGIDYTNEWEKQADRAKETLDAVDSLKGRLSEDMIDWMATLSPDELHAIATEWAGKSQDELDQINASYLNMKFANEQLTNALLSPEVKLAEKQFLDEYAQTMYELPNTAKPIGALIAQNLSNSFSEETNNLLKTFGDSGDDMIDALRSAFTITGEGTESKSEKTEAVGEAAANGVGSGFAKNQDALAEVCGNTIENSLFAAVYKVDYDGVSKVIGNGLYEAIGNIDAETDVKVTPVTSGMSAKLDQTKGKQLNSGRSVTTAYATGTSFNEGRSTDSANTDNTSATKNVTFNQTINSPKPLNRTEIRRDTVQYLTLANYS